MSAQVDAKLTSLLLEHFKDNAALITEMVKDGYSIHIPLFFGGDKKSRLMDVVRACNASLLEAEIYDYLITKLREGELSDETFEYAIVSIEKFFEKVGNTNQLVQGMHILVLERLGSILNNDDFMESEETILDGYGELLDFLMVRMTALEPGNVNKSIIRRAISSFKLSSTLLMFDMKELGW